MTILRNVSLVYIAFSTKGPFLHRKYFWKRDSETFPSLHGKYFWKRKVLNIVYHDKVHYFFSVILPESVYYLHSSTVCVSLSSFKTRYWKSSFYLKDITCLYSFVHITKMSFYLNYNIFLHIYANYNHNFCLFSTCVTQWIPTWQRKSACLLI